MLPMLRLTVLNLSRTAIAVQHDRSDDSLDRPAVSRPVPSHATTHLTWKQEEPSPRLLRATAPADRFNWDPGPVGRNDRRRSLRAIADPGVHLMVLPARPIRSTNSAAHGSRQAEPFANADRPGAVAADLRSPLNPQSRAPGRLFRKRIGAGRGPLSVGKPTGPVSVFAITVSAAGAKFDPARNFRPLPREPAPGTGRAQRGLTGFVIAAGHPPPRSVSETRQWRVAPPCRHSRQDSGEAEKAGTRQERGSESPYRRILRRFRRELPMANPVAARSRCTRCRCARARPRASPAENRALT